MKQALTIRDILEIKENIPFLLLDPFESILREPQDRFDYVVERIEYSPKVNKEKAYEFLYSNYSEVRYGA